MLPQISGVVRLTKDVELKYLPSGSALASLGLASSKKYKTQSGEQKEDKCFLSASIFGKLAEVANNYLRKGSQIYIVGEEITEQWQGQEGTQKSRQVVRISSFEMLDKKQDNQSNNAPQQQYQQPQQNNQANYNAPHQQQNNASHSSSSNQFQQNIPTIDIHNDEIPF